MYKPSAQPAIQIHAAVASPEFTWESMLHSCTDGWTMRQLFGRVGYWMDKWMEGFDGTQSHPSSTAVSYCSVLTILRRLVLHDWTNDNTWRFEPRVDPASYISIVLCKSTGPNRIRSRQLVPPVILPRKQLFVWSFDEPIVPRLLKMLAILEFQNFIYRVVSNHLRDVPRVEPMRMA